MGEGEEIQANTTLPLALQLRGLWRENRSVQPFLPGCLCELLAGIVMPVIKKFVLISSLHRDPETVKQ